MCLQSRPNYVLNCVLKRAPGPILNRILIVFFTASLSLFAIFLAYIFALNAFSCVLNSVFIQTTHWNPFNKHEKYGLKIWSRIWLKICLETWLKMWLNIWLNIGLKIRLEIRNRNMDQIWLKVWLNLWIKIWVTVRFKVWFTKRVKVWVTRRVIKRVTIRVNFRL